MSCNLNSLTNYISEILTNPALFIESAFAMMHSLALLCLLPTQVPPNFRPIAVLCCFGMGIRRWIAGSTTNFKPDFWNDEHKAPLAHAYGCFHLNCLCTDFDWLLTRRGCICARLSCHRHSRTTRELQMFTDTDNKMRCSGKSSCPAASLYIKSYSPVFSGRATR